jgi:signal transduction histidine kinase
MRAPQDVAIAGFDDIKESYGVMPSLTTVKQPLFELGARAVKTLLAVLRNGEAAPKETLMPRLIIRRSCGCFTHSQEGAASHPEMRVPSRSTSARTKYARVLSPPLHSTLSSLLARSREELDSGACGRVLEEAFEKTITDRFHNAFFLALEDIMLRSATYGIDVLSWFDVVNTIFDSANDGYDAVRIERLRNESLILVGETADRVQAYFRANAEEQSVVLHKINQSLIANFDSTKLRKVLVRELPKLGIKGCYVSMYKRGESVRSRSKLLLAFDPSGGKADTARGRTLFSSAELIPGTLRGIARYFSFIVMPLYFKREQLGFVLFEMGPISGNVYETLASQLSSAIKGAKLETKRKRLEKEITEISRKEQMRIGQDLHDGLCQHITGISFMCKVLRDQLKQKSLPEARSADEICTLLGESIATTRSLAKGLFPVELEENGFVVALGELVSTLERQSRIRCRFICTDSISIADNAMASNLFRIAQEAVTNAIKHAEAKHIEVELGEDDGKVTMKIRDDGIGLPDNIHGKGIGLATMKYRANIIGAKLAIKQAKGGGTEVVCLFKNKAVSGTGKNHKR